jgi:ribosome-associated protein
VRVAQRIRSHGARRRQLQYIGKIMRGVDPAPVLAALAAVAGRSKAAKLQQTQLENWRSRLIGDDDALTAFASDHPGVNLQTLRTLIRNSRKELDEGKPPRAQRELFRVIREALE